MSIESLGKWLKITFNEKVNHAYTSESDVRRAYRVPVGKSACDGVLHVSGCELVLVEEKTKAGIRKALRQLRSFARYLRSLDYKIRRYVILIERMSNVESKRYKGRGRERFLVEIRGGRVKPVEILNRPVHLLKKEELRITLMRWL